MAGKLSPWTPEDDARLQSLALTDADVRDIGMQLNRTENAIRSRANRLNIELRKLTLKRRR
jgi:hypothetical protein